MIFDLDDDQEAIRDSIARFVAEHYPLPPAYALPSHSLPGHARASHWAALADLGWLGVAVAQTKGGLGMTVEDWAVIVAELGRGLADEPFLSTALLAPLFLTDSNEGDAVLPDLVAGRCRVVPALLEPGRRYGFFDPATRAVEGPGGITLSGIKTQVDHGAEADIFLLSARDATGKLLLLTVDARAPGVTLTPYRSYEGRKIADLRLDDAPARALLCEGESAHDAIDRAISLAATMQAAEAVGGMEAAIDLTARFLWDRNQFNQPLARFQALQHRMADLFVDLEVARGHLHGALAGLRAGGAAAVRATSGGKVAVMRAAERVTGECIHLHGAMGMTLEHPVGHFYRHAITLEKAWGDIDYHLRRYETAAHATMIAGGA